MDRKKERQPSRLKHNNSDINKHSDSVDLTPRKRQKSKFSGK
jgi:hypothetical protein